MPSALQTTLKRTLSFNLKLILNCKYKYIWFLHLEFFFLLGFRLINLSEVALGMLGMQNVRVESTAQAFGFRHHFCYL